MTHHRKQAYTADEKAGFAAQREQTMQNLAERLAAAVAAIQDSEAFKAYLRAQAQFHRYSFRNTLLILSQCPHATRVAGYEAWRMLGRQVRKGETGIRIYAPVQYKVRNADGDEGGEGDEQTRTGFRAVAVFNVSQTDGDELPDFTVNNLVGEDGAELYDALTRIAEADGLTITYTPPKKGSNANGTYLPNKQAIYIKEQARFQMTKTLAHELAHHLDPRLAEATGAEQETVAEGVAYLVLAHFGLDSSDYTFRYIAGWNGNQDGRETLTRCMERIQKIARTLIDQATKHLDPQASEPESEQAIAA
jgi:antirestriction protein ArdC